MKSSSRTILPEVRLSPRAYKLGFPGGGSAEDDSDPEVRLHRLEATYQAKLAALQERLTAEKQRAFADGLQEGRRQAEVEALARLDALLSQWAGLLDQVIKVRRDAMHVSETQLIELVIGTVEKLIAARPDDPGRIAQTLREAFDLLVTKDKLTIICSPADATFIRNFLTGHRGEFEDITKFTVREDPAITSGGCLVETEWGTIDARVEKRLAVVKQLWRDAARAPVHEPEEDDA